MINHPSEALVTDVVPPYVLKPWRQNSEFRAQKREPWVLIADDDPNVGPLVSAALRPYDIHTEAVGSGEDALNRLRMRKYDLVVLDLEMADIHGFEVLRALRDLPRYKKPVPVLILTANTSDDALARSFGYGADEFVKKPFDLRELGVRAFRLIRPFGNE
jgi:two-component system cell cycle response regulator CtrA